MGTMRSSGRQNPGRGPWRRRFARGFPRNSALVALAAVALLAGGVHLYPQHSNTGSAGLAVQVNPADLLTITGGNTASLKIRLGTGPAVLWGDSLSDCSSAPTIGNPTTIGASGSYSYPLTSVPYNSTSNDYVCVYSSGTPSLNTSVAWPHTGLNLVFGTQPTQAAAGASISPAVTVQVKDSNGILVASSTASVTIAIGTNPSSGTLSGTLTQTAVNGVATFGNLSINKDGTGYTLTASSSGITSGTSNAFNIISNGVSASTSTVSASPTSVTANGTSTSTITVTLNDADGNPVSGKTVTLAQGSGHSSISAASGPSSSSGVVTFTVTDTTAETVTYTATDTSDSTVITQTAQVTFTAGAINHFAISAISSPQTAGTAFTISTITAQDVNNNTVTSFASTVTYGGTAGVTGTSAAFTAGVLSGASVTPTVAGSNLTVTVNDGSGHTGSATIATVNPGAINHFAISAISSPQTAGTAFNITTITAQDTNNNTVTSFTSTVTYGGTAGVTGTSAAFTAGVLSGASVTPTVAGSNLTVTVTDGSGHTGTATITTVNAGTASKLVWSTEPAGNVNPGAALSTQPAVEVEDAYNNPILSSPPPVTLAITSGTGNSAGTLTCTTNPVTPSTSTGIATFAGCSISASGTGYTLTATTSSPSLTSPASSAFTINGPTKLVFTTEPSAGALTAGACNTFTVTSENSSGTATDPTSQLTVNLATGHSGGTFYSGSGCSGSITSTSIGTSASAATVYYEDTTATTTGYTVTVATTTLPGITTATSNSYTVVAGTATQLVFTTQPVGGVNPGAALATQPAVEVEDANGNPILSSPPAVTLSITTGTGNSAGTLTCTTNPVTPSTSTGIATFAGCSISASGSGYTLTAKTSSPSLSVASSSFTINGPTKLVFTTEPATGALTAGACNTFTVTSENSSGTATDPTSQLTVNLATGHSGGTFYSGSGCTGSITSTSIGTSASAVTVYYEDTTATTTGYTVTAATSTLPGITTATSNSYTVVAGAASKLVWSTEPAGNVNPGAALSTQPAVEVEDANGNPILSSPPAVTLAISTGTGNSAGTLTCTTNPVTPSTSTGIATFAGCSISASGTGYTLTATTSSPSLTSPASSAFTINGPTKLVFTTEPSAGALTAGACNTFTVTSENSSGTATDPTSALTVNLATGHSSGTFYSGSGCSGSITSTSIGTSASAVTVYYEDTTATTTGYTVTAATSTLPGITTATSNSYTVVAGAATKLVYTTVPSTGTAGTAFSVTVQSQDANGNPSSPTSNTTITLSKASGGGTLSGTLTGTILSTGNNVTISTPVYSKSDTMTLDGHGDSRGDEFDRRSPAATLCSRRGRRRSWPSRRSPAAAQAERRGRRSR